LEESSIIFAVILFMSGHSKMKHWRDSH